MLKKFEINFNGESEIWFVSPDDDCAVFSYKKAQEMVKSAGKKMPCSSELLEKDPETGKSRLELLKEAGADFWGWVADKTVDPLNAAFVTSADEHKGECEAWFVRGVICH